MLSGIAAIVTGRLVHIRLHFPEKEPNFGRIRVRVRCRVSLFGNDPQSEKRAKGTMLLHLRL